MARMERAGIARMAIVGLALATLACLGGPTGPGSAPKGSRALLFVGNSLTAWNDMPLMVEALGANDSRPIWVRTVAYPNVHLGDHLRGGDAVPAVRQGGWDVVVLQQGPSSVPENRAALREWAATFAVEIRAAGARPALYAVWPQRVHLATFDAASESYALAAQDVDGLLFPVGEAWRAAWRADPALELYAPDGLHPNAAGSYLAAIVIYATIAERSPVGLPHELQLRDGATLRIPARLAALLQEAAREAIGADAASSEQ